MSSELNKENLSKPNIDSKNNNEFKRPSIDNLVRKILIEKKRKINSIILMSITLVIIAFVAFIL